MRLRDLTCSYCLAPHSALRFDRKSRPYFSCVACGARCFLTSLRDAVRHLALVEPIAHARAQEMEQDAKARAKAADHEGRIAAAFRLAMSASVASEVPELVAENPPTQKGVAR